ncbi:MAG: hypothetical protein MUF84_16630 [Anaerolineae bacterium]|nr:hypothetical protein [Anaerolineae bacterium]
MKPRLRLIMAALLMALGAVGPVAAQSTLPIAFSDPAPGIVSWPDPIEATILNNTTSSLVVTLQFTPFTDESGTDLPAAELLQRFPSSITLAPAGQASVSLPIREEAPLAPGSYTSSLVLALESHNVVLRRTIVIVVPPPPTAPAAIAPLASPVAAAPALTPAVTTWTLNAFRVLPFVDPICVRGLVTGCSLPVTIARSGAVPEFPASLGHLSSERGGGLAISMLGATARRGAALELAFDRRWGLTGAYQGQIDLVPDNPELGAVDLTVNVKDIVVWPLLCLWFGVATARYVQRYMTVRRETLKLLERLNAVSLEFAKLRKSVHGYTVAEDFEVRREQLDMAIRAWDRDHFGELSETEREAFVTTILAPLEALEVQTTIWSQFRDKLDRLGRTLLQDARPAVDHAELPAGVDLKEPRFFTNGRALLRGTKLQMPQVPEYGERIDKASDLAASWGELAELAMLVRDAIRELNRPGVDLSLSEHEMLETARHHLNSAARDLWEAPNLDDLRRRNAEKELTTAQEITRRLMDPFVYYAGAGDSRELDSPSDAALAAGSLSSLSAEALGKLPPMVRTYARVEAFRLPRIGLDSYEVLTGASERLVYVKRALLFGEQTITWAALLTSVVAGLERYLTTNFGSPADYLALLTWGLASKAGLELVNAALTRWLPPRE